MDQASELIFPALNLPMRQHRHQIQVWDAFRKRWVKAGPEEWVRQHAAHYLIQDLGYPATRLLVEHQAGQGRHSRRYDLMVLGRDLAPLILMECKAPSEKLDDEVWWQTLCYQQQKPAIFLVITNGLQMKIRLATERGWESVEGLPSRAAWEANGEASLSGKFSGTGAWPGL